MSIPGGNSTELCEVLDGEVRRVPGGYDCIACGRALFVPYTLTSDATHALLLCRQSALCTEKLTRMDQARAWVVYLTTPPRPEPTN